MKTHFALVALLVTGSLGLAQSNSTPGVDLNLYNIDNGQIFGREGPTHPGGRIGFSSANYICNSGSVIVPFQGAMNPDHPKFALLVTRLSDDRMVQISDRSFVKHAFGSLNFNIGPCVPCQNPGTFSVMGIGCWDVYTSGINGDRQYLGPADEIDPWLGTWNPVASYFDRGDPDVGPPQNSDGLRSLSGAQISAFGTAKNRVTIEEQDLLVPNASFFYAMQVVIENEPVDARGNNLRSRGVNFSWNGSSWSNSNTTTSVAGSPLNQWPGAEVNLGGNGPDDGRFAVAVKVTGPVDGLWHYEYAVHNIDNSRGGASLRIPSCPTARVENLGFHDIDGNGLNQWTPSVNAGEILWSAPIDNALKWNSIFNFWFDSDAAPVPGSVQVDQALLGPGSATIAVTSQVPGLQPTVDLGAGCGTPTPRLWSNEIPSAPNPNYALVVEAAPSTGTLLFFTYQAANTVLAPGCTQYLAGTSPSTVGFFLTDGAGRTSVPLGIPPGMQPITVYFQAAALETNGPVFDAFGISNGLAVRVAPAGCQ